MQRNQTGNKSASVTNIVWDWDETQLCVKSEQWHGVNIPTRLNNIRRRKTSTNHF